MPKTIYSKEDILISAIAVINKHGIEKLTAKSLSKQLKSSIQPIYHNFSSLKEIRLEFYKYFESNFIQTFSEFNDLEIFLKAFLELCYQNINSFKSFFFLSSKDNYNLEFIKNFILNKITALNSDNILKNKPELTFELILAFSSLICFEHLKFENESSVLSLLKKHIIY